MRTAAELVVWMDSPACDPTLQLVARLVDITRTLLQGAEGTTNAPHADACRRSAREVHGAVMRLLDGMPEGMKERRDLRRQAGRLGERLSRAGPSPEC